MKVPVIEKRLGIEIFATKTRGVGGMIKHMPEDFQVQEILVDNSKAELEPHVPPQLRGEGRYLICLLVKSNWDTLLAVRIIAKQLGVSERRVRVAGIKDKKALTAQHMSIENVKAERIKRIQVDGIHVYPLRYSPNMVFPHMLFGNMFHITIRNISHSLVVSQERISHIVNTLSQGGIPNFFGHQRFGTSRPITHLVGKALAKNDLEKAALLFLAKASSYEHPQAREARQMLWQNRDFEEALNMFPRRLLFERLMLSHMVKHPLDFVGAFRRLPQQLRSLFLQAYQSYLFNRSLSQRLKRGIPINEPEVGDYVVRTDSHGLPSNSYVRAAPENLGALREAMAKGAMYVAIPLIGFKQAPSEGAQGEIERAVLESEKVTQESFHVASMPEMSAAGELRAALTPVMDLNVGKLAKDELNLGRRKLRLGFKLHRGCYATVVLREILKPRNLLKAGF